MTAQNYYAGVGHVGHVSTNVWKPCQDCGASIGNPNDDYFDEVVNHYINQHGYKVLHVGTETTHDPDGKPWHNTVAVVGK